MTQNSPARMIVVKKEDKGLKLRLLIDQAVASVAMTGLPVQMRVLAQSMASPVVVAVLGARRELEAAGIEAHIVLAKLEFQPDYSFTVCNVWRHVADLRCHDAHEMLVIGTQAAWIGDSLRRDPVARDSFELHAPNDGLTARLVTQSFDRIWQLSTPIQRKYEVADAGLAACLSGLPAAVAPPQVLTRH